MQNVARVIETTAVIEDDYQLRLTDPIRAAKGGNIRVLLFLPDEEDVDETEWLRAASGNPSFGFLRDRCEDVYSPTDGRPYDDER